MKQSTKQNVLKASRAYLTAFDGDTVQYRANTSRIKQVMNNMLMGPEIDRDNFIKDMRHSFALEEKR